MHEPNNSFKIYEAKLDRTAGEIEKSITIVRSLNTIVSKYITSRKSLSILKT